MDWTLRAMRLKVPSVMDLPWQAASAVRVRVPHQFTTLHHNCAIHYSTPQLYRQVKDTDGAIHDSRTVLASEDAHRMCSGSTYTTHSHIRDNLKADKFKKKKKKTWRAGGRGKHCKGQVRMTQQKTKNDTLATNDT